jgi:hypothetical protein
MKSIPAKLILQVLVEQSGEKEQPKGNFMLPQF